MERVMERLGSVGFGSVLLVCLVSGTSALFDTASPHSVCKSCDPQPANCKLDQCIVNCNISKVCPSPDDVCAAVWWREKGVVTVETKCHDSTQPLNDVMLDNNNSSDCVLTVRNMDTPNLRQCACTGRECNGRLLLNKPDDQNVKLPTSETKGAFRLPQLCRFCDIQPTACNATGICESSCNLISICKNPDEVCISAWRRNKGNPIIETVCHNPALPFHGQYLTDYNNTICLMKQVEGMEDDFYICSCNYEECNDQLFFPGVSPPPGAVEKNFPPVVLISLVSPLIAAVVLISIFYCYRVLCQQNLKAPKTKGIDRETCAIIMSDDDRSDSSSANANSLNHNTELLPYGMKLDSK